MADKAQRRVKCLNTLPFFDFKFFPERCDSMELQYLEYFMKVVELQHVSHAAEELHMAQPALSRIIRRLEDELGTSLFERVGKNIMVNENGKIVYKYAGMIFETLGKMRTEIEYRQKMEQRVVKLGFNSASILMPGLMAKYHACHPEVTVEFTGQSSNNPGTMFFIDSYFRPQTRNDFIPLLEESFYLAYSEKHRFAQLNDMQLTPMEYAKETFLYSKGCHSAYEATKAFAKHNDFEPMGIMECVSTETIMTFLESGMGVALIPNISWNISKHPTIVYRTIPGRPLVRRLYMQIMLQLDSFPAGNSFVAFCKSYFEMIQQLVKKHNVKKESIVELVAKTEMARGEAVI